MSSKLSRAFQEKSQEISLCSIILNLAEDTNVVLEQKATYPANMFISDIGGSAGLILGISFLSIIKLSIQGWDKPYIIQLLVIVIYYLLYIASVYQEVWNYNILSITNSFLSVLY